MGAGAEGRAEVVIRSCVNGSDCAGSGRLLRRDDAAGQECWWHRSCWAEFRIWLAGFDGIEEIVEELREIGWVDSVIAERLLAWARGA